MPERSREQHLQPSLGLGCRGKNQHKTMNRLFTEVSSSKESSLSVRQKIWGGGIDDGVRDGQTDGWLGGARDEGGRDVKGICELDLSEITEKTLSESLIFIKNKNKPKK